MTTQDKIRQKAESFSHKYAEQDSFAKGMEEVINNPAEYLSQQLSDEEKKWKLIRHSYQIADTGDYDGQWEVTDGKIKLWTERDYDEEEIQEFVDLLNKGYKAAQQP